jgi:hypothetical protein
VKNSESGGKQWSVGGFLAASQLVENPSTPRSGAQKPRHCSVLALMSRCLDAVLDYRAVLQRLFQPPDTFQAFE